MSDLLDGIREAIRAKSYVISVHMLGRLLDRGIDLGDVAHGLVSDSTEVIEDYAAHHLGPCCLILCRGPSGRWYHVVCSHPPIVTMVTVYEPAPAQWTADFRRRLDPQ